jgi:hypothetical protein
MRREGHVHHLAAARRDHRLARDGLGWRGRVKRHSLLVASLGFSLVGLYVAVFQLAILLGIPRTIRTWNSVPDISNPYGLTSVVLAVFSLPVFAWTTWQLRRSLGQRSDPADRRLVRGYRQAMGLAVATALLTFATAVVSARAGQKMLNVFDGFWTLTQPLLLTYAIVRHQLFDLDVRLKWTVKQSTIAGAFVAVFFAASEGTQAFFGDQGNEWVGIGAAALLVFAIAPLQRFAQRVADTAMPLTRPLGELPSSERSDLYRDQVRAAWEDGKLDRSERAMLRNLRTRLGLSADDAERIEAEITG